MLGGVVALTVGHLLSIHAERREGAHPVQHAYRQRYLMRILQLGHALQLLAQRLRAQLPDLGHVQA
ncbi:MAG: hypothetical protein ACRD0Y_08155 [Terriglobales bacterium]